MGSSDRPLGWRKRIGVMSPTVMETANHDFFRVAPERKPALVIRAVQLVLQEVESAPSTFGSALRDRRHLLAGRKNARSPVVR